MEITMKQWVEITKKGNPAWAKCYNGKILEIRQVGEDYQVVDVTKKPKVIGCEDNPSKAKAVGNEYLAKGQYGKQTRVIFRQSS